MHVSLCNVPFVVPHGILLVAISPLPPKIEIEQLYTLGDRDLNVNVVVVKLACSVDKTPNSSAMVALMLSSSTPLQLG